MFDGRSYVEPSQNAQPAFAYNVLSAGCLFRFTSDPLAENFLPPLVAPFRQRSFPRQKFPLAVSSSVPPAPQATTNTYPTQQKGGAAAKQCRTIPLSD